MSRKTLSEELLFNILVKNLLKEFKNLLNLKRGCIDSDTQSDIQSLMGSLIHDRIELNESNNPNLKIVSVMWFLFDIYNLMN